jgi:GNAT superfamily N-acetyltransferase
MSAVVVRGLREDELDAADRIFRLAFGTFLGLPDPLRFAGDADYVRTRWRSDPTRALAAEVDGRLVGSNFVTTWGSLGFFGPLTVEPALWDRGVATALMERTVALLDARGATHQVLFTFPQSAKHIGLYGRFGFHPRFLTALAGKAVAPAPRGVAWTPLSALPPAERAAAIAGCRAVADALLAGFDPSGEIAAVAAQELGDTVIVPDARGAVRGFAICHVGRGTEAGSDTCYVKLAAVPSGAIDDMSRLVDAVETFAAMRGATRLVAGVNAGRERAWKLMRSRGFRAEIQGVALHRPNVPGTATADAFVLDDWR